jgi:hypothetical protein
MRSRSVTLHREIDDHRFGMISAVEFIAEGGCPPQACDASVLQNAPAVLAYDQVIVENEDAAHAIALLTLRTLAAALPGSSTGTVIHTQVPRSASLSIT